MMKTARFFALIFLAATSVSLRSQQVNTTGQEQGSTRAADTQVNNTTQASASANASPKGVHATGSAEGASNVSTKGPTGFGDQASSHAYEMSSVTGELEGKLDSKHARVGDRVVLKTTEKVRTADGTVIPKGTRLVGHVTQVQTRDKAHAVSQMGIAFDRAELKNGQSFAIHTLIRGVSPSPSVMAMNSMNSDDQMSAMAGPMGGGMDGGAMGGGGRGLVGGRSGGGLLGGGGNVAGGVMQRTAETTASMGDRVGETANEDVGGAVRMAGHGDLTGNVGAHQFAAARMVPHATSIPGVMLAGNSSASGMFSAPKKNIEFESGTQMELGIVKDR